MTTRREEGGTRDGRERGGRMVRPSLSDGCSVLGLNNQVHHFFCYVFPSLSLSLSLA